MSPLEKKRHAHVGQERNQAKMRTLDKSMDKRNGEKRTFDKPMNKRHEHKVHWINFCINGTGKTYILQTNV